MALARVTLAVLVVCLAFSGQVMSDAPVAGAEGPYTFLFYRVERHGLPASVVMKDLTISVHVGEVQGVAVLADGTPIESWYDPQTERVTFTTDGQDLAIVLDDLSSAYTDIGEATLARLKYDKKWALSVNLDDGYVSQYTNGFRFLDRYGYRGSIGLVGSFLDWNDPEYINAEQMKELLEKGWEIANHSYSHRAVSYYEAMGMTGEQIMRAEILQCNEALDRAVRDYRPYSFFVPFGDAAYFPLVRDYNEVLLGFNAMGHSGYDLHDLDDLQEAAIFEFGRKHIPRDGSRFDDIHAYVTNNPSKRYWLRTLDHSVDDYASDTEMAIDYLYYHYGAGGTDEVWVDSVAAVHQYILCQRHSTIAAVTSQQLPALDDLVWATWPPPVEPTPPTTTVVFQQGTEGYEGANDTFLLQWHPDSVPGAGGLLQVRAFDVARALLRFDVSTIPTDAVVTEAKLHLYCDDAERPAGEDSHSISIEIYGMLREWDEGTATWNRAATGEPWAQAGCMAPGEDYAPERIGLPARTLILQGDCRYSRQGDCWYTMDVASIVSEWVANPLANRGILLRALSNANFETWFVSSNHWSVSEHPKLEVTYAEPTPAPPGIEIPLVEGANLVSFPVIPPDTSVPEVLASVWDNVSKVYVYDASDDMDPWKYHIKGLPPEANTLADLDNTMGFWLYMDTADVLVVDGQHPGTTELQLYEGANLIAYPSVVTRTLASVLAPIDGKWTGVYRYDASNPADPWRYHIAGLPPEANTLHQFEPGNGYWLYASEDCTLSITD